jgi:hypothetical protein
MSRSEPLPVCGLVRSAMAGRSRGAKATPDGGRMEPSHARDWECVAETPSGVDLDATHRQGSIGAPGAAVTWTLFGA